MKKAGWEVASHGYVRAPGAHRCSFRGALFATTAPSWVTGGGPPVYADVSCKFNNAMHRRVHSKGTVGSTTSTSPKTQSVSTSGRRLPSTKRCLGSDRLGFIKGSPT